MKRAIVIAMIAIATLAAAGCDKIIPSNFNAPSQTYKGS